MATEVYRWVDEDGAVHYSDEPVEGAEKIKLRDVDTYPAPRAPEPAVRARDSDDKDKVEPVYNRLRFIVPAHDEVVWVTGGFMYVLVRSQPRLRPGHEIVLYLDGEKVAETPTRDTGITVTGMIRGTKQLQAAIVDADGKELIRSDAITIHARAHSILYPLQRR